uniref:Uncharacterized protein n=1 Tax=Klebsiella pneumoniae TaxID=573 RepID=A0A223DQH7_KLEPN|nr:Hypothetical protein [Klebsiella pneumoniae]
MVIIMASTDSVQSMPLIKENVQIELMLKAGEWLPPGLSYVSVKPRRSYGSTLRSQSRRLIPQPQLSEP